MHFETEDIYDSEMYQVSPHLSGQYHCYQSILDSHPWLLPHQSTKYGREVEL